MLKKVLFVLVPALAVVVAMSSAVIAARPSRYRVTRSESSPASAAAIFALVTNPRAWERWSPWAPGTVEMTVLDSRTPTRVRMQLELTDPVRSAALATIDLEPTPNHQTIVTWTVEGTHGFAGKAWSLVQDMNAVLAPKLERGIGNLGRLSELTRRW